MREIIMMFLLDLAFTIELFVLGAGMALLIWGMRNEGEGVALAKAGSYFIIIAVLLTMACTTYYGVRYWMRGDFIYLTPDALEETRSLEPS